MIEDNDFNEDEYDEDEDTGDDNSEGSSKIPHCPYCQASFNCRHTVVWRLNADGGFSFSPSPFANLKPLRNALDNFIACVRSKSIWRGSDWNEDQKAQACGPLLSVYQSFTQQLKDAMFGSSHFDTFFDVEEETDEDTDRMLSELFDAIPRPSGVECKWFTENSPYEYAGGYEWLFCAEPEQVQSYYTGYAENLIISLDALIALEPEEIEDEQT